jgi:hypothetical protein
MLMFFSNQIQTCLCVTLIIRLGAQLRAVWVRPYHVTHPLFYYLLTATYRKRLYFFYKSRDPTLFVGLLTLHHWVIVNRSIFANCIIKLLFEEYTVSLPQQSARKTLQRVVRTPSTSHGPSFLPSRTYILGGVRGRPQNIVKDSSYPSHRLFSLLQHPKWYRSAKSRSKRIFNSFFPQAIRLLNKLISQMNQMAIQTKYVDPPFYFYSLATRC